MANAPPTPGAGHRAVPSAQCHGQGQPLRASSLSGTISLRESPAGSSPSWLLQHNPLREGCPGGVFVPTPSGGQSSLDVLPLLPLPFWKMTLAVAQITRSVSRSAAPSGEQSLTSHWHSMTPPNPGMLPSQSHSHLVNGLIRYCKDQCWPELGFTRCSAWPPVSCLSLQQWSGGCPFHGAGRSTACCPAAREKPPHIRKPEQTRAHPLSEEKQQEPFPAHTEPHPRGCGTGPAAAP